jgi:hypothetical protein
VIRPSELSNVHQAVPAKLFDFLDESGDVGNWRQNVFGQVDPPWNVIVKL